MKALPNPRPPPYALIILKSRQKTSTIGTVEASAIPQRAVFPEPHCESARLQDTVSLSLKASSETGLLP